MPSAAVSAPLLILLAIAGFALAISQFGSGSSSSSSSVAAASGTSASVPSAAAGSAHGASGHAFGKQSQSSIARGPAFQGLKFSIGESGISYSASTLASQVRTELNALNQVTPAASATVPTASGSTPSIEASASSSASANAPASTPAPPNLKGCVSYLTKGATPSLVDRSTYDGIPAYIIAVPSRVWVVRLGCTAADPQEITSVSLTGLSGNLSALGSVEGYASPEERRMQ
jgi:hypothetical protein